MKELHDFKKEVLERGLPAKREITFETEHFGLKTFLTYAEPIFSESGVTIGINCMGMDVTDQVSKRERMTKLREAMAVQKAKETELNKTIHITEESMRAKQMLATMSHEIRSPLTGVVSMAEILSTTELSKEQRQLLKVMLSSGDLILQLINDILDLSKVESGVMRLEATIFRPREVVKHVLQTAAASLQKLLTLEGHVAHDVPVEVIGGVLRIRQILTNLVSNAIKFTHEGKVGINLYAVQLQEPSTTSRLCSQKLSLNQSTVSDHMKTDMSMIESRGDLNSNGHEHENGTRENRHLKNVITEGDEEEDTRAEERVVWICCDVYDTGIGIPENARPTLFKKYMQADADTARKYGGTGLGLAICKQLVELMGGHLSVSSEEHQGSTFTFVLPYKVSSASDYTHQDILDEDMNSGVFLFNLNTPQASRRFQNLDANNFGPHKHHGRLLMEDLPSPTSPEFAPPAGISGVGSRPKILLVEDSKINVMVARSMMKQLGHEIAIARNGAEAVLAVQSNHYHLILMDVCMPVMNGLQATRLIRSYEESGNWDEALKAGVDSPLPSPNSCSNSQVGKTRKRTPIIAMTANAMSESVDECYANWMDSFITKPITFQNLKQSLQQYLL